MDYEYKPRAKEFVIKHSKNISIVILVILIVFAFSEVNSFLTGYASFNEELKKNLSDYELRLVSVNQKFSTCSNNLKIYEANLKNCESQKTEAANYSNTLKTNLDTCISDKTSIQANYTNMEQNCNSIIKASVQTKCCSYDDVWTGTIKNWNLKDGKILCSGNYTVNCTSGETSY